MQAGLALYWWQSLLTFDDGRIRVNIKTWSSSRLCNIWQVLYCDLLLFTDKKEMVAMIESLVAANQFFSEFPRKNEPEKQHLLQKQNEYMV